MLNLSFSISETDAFIIHLASCSAFSIIVVLFLFARASASEIIPEDKFLASFKIFSHLLLASAIKPSIFL